MIRKIGKSILHFIVWILLLPVKFFWYCIKSLYHSFVREVLKHILKWLGFTIAYVLPTIYILFTLIKVKPERIGYFGGSLLIVGLLALLWFFGIKKQTNEKLKELKLANRLEHGGNVVLTSIISFIDNAFKVVPSALLYLLTQSLELLTIKASDFFLILFVLTCMGRILYWIDDNINLNKNEIKD